MNYKELLFEFLKNRLNREYCAPILKNLLRANLREGKYTIGKGKEKLEVSPNDVEKKIEEICEHMVKINLKEGYKAFVVPSMISEEQAPNFYVFPEKPSEEELWWWLYHLLTGIHYQDLVINIANVPKKINEKFREYLINQNFLIFESEESGLNVGEMLNRVEAPKGIPIGRYSFVFGFLMLSYFAKFWKREKEKEEFAKELGKKVEEITDDTSLIIFVLSRQKKKVYIFPKLKDLISKWFSEFSEQETPLVTKFFLSFYISDKDYRVESLSLLDKTLYYFLQGHVNGELLSKLIELKISYELKKKGRIYGIRNAKDFFFKL